MADLSALSNSLVNIDRNSPVAIISSESEAAHRLVNSARQRTTSQRANEAVERAIRIERIFIAKMATWRRRCPSATSGSANLLKTDCVFAVGHNFAFAGRQFNLLCSSSLSLHDVDVRSDLYLFVQLDDVRVVHAKTAVRDCAADRAGPVGPMNPV
jgi:hypothetical protein